MSVIAVQGVPHRWNLPHVMKTLAPVVGGKFEALNFVSGPGKNLKTCYLRLSNSLDPVEVVENINTKLKHKQARMRALIPDYVPDLPVSLKPKKIPLKLAKALRIPIEDTPQKVLRVTLMEILTEMQSKFTGLFNLSSKTLDHQLLEDVGRTIVERMKNIMNTNTEAATTCFKLSSSYRQMHPHFGDFQLILSKLHEAQDAAGEPRSELTEEQLTGVKTELYSVDKIPYNRIQSATSEYSLKITKKILEHIRKLKAAPAQTGTDEDVAQERVRHELKNMAQHLPSIIRQVIQTHLSPKTKPFHRMRIYGEPFLPNKEHMSPLTRRHRAVKVSRDDRMYNLLKLNIPQEHYASLIALDGTFISGAKLVIRSSDIPLYKPRCLKAKIRLPGAARAPDGADSDGADYDGADYDVADCDDELELENAQ